MNINKQYQSSSKKTRIDAFEEDLWAFGTTQLISFWKIDQFWRVGDDSLFTYLNLVQVRNIFIFPFNRWDWTYKIQNCVFQQVALLMHTTLHFVKDSNFGNYCKNSIFSTSDGILTQSPSKKLIFKILQKKLASSLQKLDLRTCAGLMVFSFPPSHGWKRKPWRLLVLNCHLLSELS